MVKKRRPGRPRLPKGEGQTIVVTVRMSKQDRRIIETAAKKSGAKLSEWIRATLLSAVDHGTLDEGQSEGGGFEPHGGATPS